MIFPPISNNSNPIKKMSRILKASVLLLCLSVPLHAAPEAILRLDPGGHTGVVRKLVITPDGRLVTASDELIRTESGVVVMTASTGSEFSVEDTSWGHGAFTKALLDGLDGPADYDRDGVITLKELDLYVTRSVKTLTKGQQRPTTTIPTNLPDFPLFVR